MADLVESQHFSSAEEFLAFLEPRHSHWGGGGRVRWMFRGQTDDSHSLLPSAWRDKFRTGLVYQAICRDWADALANQWCDENFDGETPTANTLAGWVESLQGPMKRQRFRDAICQVMAEADVVIHFHNLADELGFDVPEVRQELTFMNEVTGAFNTRYRYRKWCARNPTTIHGFAQHHRVPTRLLDWTLAPRTAAFFAVPEGTAETCSPVVWALNEEAVSKNMDPNLPNWQPEDEEPSVAFLTCPRSRHTFLHAQSGLFTWIRGGDRYFIRNGRYPTVEEALASHCAEEKGPILRRLTLAPSEVGKLGQLLMRERISRAHLMPSLDNVAATIEREVEYES